MAQRLRGIGMHRRSRLWLGISKVRCGGFGDGVRGSEKVIVEVNSSGTGFSEAHGFSRSGGD
jgi:hypothetical protein